MDDRSLILATGALACFISLVIAAFGLIMAFVINPDKRFLYHALATVPLTFGLTMFLNMIKETLERL